MTLQNSKPINVPFPVKGLDKHWAYGSQPQGTTADAKNVRAYDSLERRLRGGSRPGLSKWFASAIEGTNDILNMNRLTTTPSSSPGTITSFPASFVDNTGHIQFFSLEDGSQDSTVDTGGSAVHEIVRDYEGNVYAVGSVGDSGYNCWKYNSSLVAQWGVVMDSENISLTSIDYDPGTHRLVVCGARGADLNYVWVLDADTGGVLYQTDPQLAGSGGLTSVRFDSNGNIFVANYANTACSYKGLIKYDKTLTELWSWWCKQSAQGGDVCLMEALAVTSDDGVIVGGTPATSFDNTEGGTTTENKNVWGFDSDGNLLWSYLTDSGGAAIGSNHVECLFVPSGEDDKVYIGKDGGTDVEQLVKIDISDVDAITEDWTYSISSNANHEVQAIDEDADGNIIIGGNRSTTWTDNDGTNKILWRLQASDGALHANDSWPIDVAATNVTDLASSTTDNSYSATSRQSALTLVMSDGDIVAIRDVSGTPTEINPTGGAVALTNTATELPFSQPAFGKMFFIDGLNEVYYSMYDDSADDTVTVWTPTSGVMPVNPKLMTLYRGRIVLSGVASDPHNWFMTKVGDPFNFDYTPSTATAIQAVAGNNSEAGLVGDFVTSLIPYNDDLLIFGCDHTIWAMSGDPAAGGSLDEISDKTGILWGKAWTTGPKGEIYFAGTDGIYRLVPGQSLENITSTRIKKIYDAIDRSADRVLLEWDYQQQGLMMLIVDDGWVSTSAQTVYFWEERTEAWWEDTYPAAIGPMSIYAYDADDPDDKAFLMGGADSFIRKVDFAVGYDIAANDAQTVIDSYVEFPPMYLNQDRTNTKLTELRAILAESSGDVDLLFKVAESSERLTSNATTKFKRTLSAGRNTMKPRLAANTIGLELNTSSATRWAIDSMNAVVSSQGRVRRTRSS